jgi:DNA-nicking Smr family endonuclease
VETDVNKMRTDRKEPKSDQDDDATLFRRAAGGARRLHSDRVYHDRVRPRPAPVLGDTAEGSAEDIHPYASYAPSSHGSLFHASPGVQRKVIRMLKRGQIRIEDQLDLHGMRVREAGEALATFLSRCSQRGLRCVRVIHGKGLRTGGSVLKENVATWLRLRNEVVAFCSAAPNDGGTGAVYVLLKK